MVEEKVSLASEEPLDDPFDLDIQVYALPVEDQAMQASTNPTGSSGGSCTAHCVGSFVLPAE